MESIEPSQHGRFAPGTQVPAEETNNIPGMEIYF